MQDIHGKLDHLAEVDMTPETHYHIKVIFEDKEEMMDIAKNQTVLDLKKFLRGFCKIPINRMLICEYIKGNSYLNDLNYNSRMLHTFKWTKDNELHIKWK